MDPLFGVVLADLGGQNLRCRERLAGRPSFESASLCVQFIFQQDEEYCNGWAGPSTHLQFVPARVLSFFRDDDLAISKEDPAAAAA